MMKLIVLQFPFIFAVNGFTASNIAPVRSDMQPGRTEDAARLMDDKSVKYNKLIRPVVNNSDVVRVQLGLRLTQILDVHERAQIVTTNVWLKQEWYDPHFVWDPAEYGGIKALHVPADKIWLPHIVLYNNADGNYEAQIYTKAIIYFNGTINWEPPARYKSMCEIKIRWFPFDEQKCELRFGSWTYDASEVDVDFFDNILPDSMEWVPGHNWTRVFRAIDISTFSPSVEWDLIEVPAERHEMKYSCCEARYVDITFNLNIRRKTLFYTVNLMIPCIGQSLLTTLVFYLPCDCREKVVLTVSILISLTLFFLLLIDIIPSTSIEMPLIGLYLIFTMVLVILSISITVITLNLHHRSPDTHHLPAWARTIFIQWLPYFLYMRRPTFSENRRKMWRRKSIVSIPRSVSKKPSTASWGDYSGQFSFNNYNNWASPRNSTSDTTFLKPPDFLLDHRKESLVSRDSTVTFALNTLPSVEVPEPAHSGTEEVVFISTHFKKKTLYDDACEDWKFVAQVFDRIFLYIFCCICVCGTIGIVMRAPVIYDTRPPLNQNVMFEGISDPYAL